MRQHESFVPSVRCDLIGVEGQVVLERVALVARDLHLKQLNHLVDWLELGSIDHRRPHLFLARTTPTYLSRRDFITVKRRHAVLIVDESIILTLTLAVVLVDTCGVAVTGLATLTVFIHHDEPVSLTLTLHELMLVAVGLRELVDRVAAQGSNRLDTPK